MRIAYAADDANETTRAVVAYLSERGHEVVAPVTSGKWPDIGAAVGRAVVEGQADCGIPGSPGVPGAGTTPTCSR